MYGPTKEEWNALKERLSVDQIVEGTVIRREVYGIFLNIGEVPVGFVDVVCLDRGNDKTLSVEDYPAPGQKVRAKILDFNDRGRQVRLMMYGVPQDEH